MGRKNIGDKTLNGKIIKLIFIALLGAGLSVIVLRGRNDVYISDSKILRDTNGKEKKIVLYANTEYGKDKLKISVIPQGGVEVVEDEQDLLSTSTKEEENEIFLNELETAVQYENENSIDEKYLVLPSKVNGVDITWEQTKDRRILAIPVLVLIISFWILFKDRITMSDDEKKRKEKLLSEYPSFALKYALLNEAGLTHVQTLEKMGQYYAEDNSCGELYRLVYMAVNSIKGGQSIYDALDMLSNECRVREISRFIGIIKRNIRKGGSDLAIQLKNVAKESEEISRERIRKKAETASTRLLMPMMILLLIVFVVIMIPAFGNFSFG